MGEEILREKLLELSKVVDYGEYPQTADMISTMLSGYPDDDFDVACALEQCDKTTTLHPSVASFIEEVLLNKIESQSFESANLLGVLYYSGRIGEQNYEKAVKYYSLAAQWGSAVASENLGYCYYYGRLGEVDYEKAFHHFAKGAFLGMPISLYKIGDMYRYGYYVKKDEMLAFEIYNYALCATEKGDENQYQNSKCDIYMRIADFLFEGDAIKQDYNTAIELYAFSMNEFRKRITNEGEYYLKGNYEHCKEMVRKLSDVLESEFPEWDPQATLN